MPVNDGDAEFLVAFDKLNRNLEVMGEHLYNIQDALASINATLNRALRDEEDEIAPE